MSKLLINKFFILIALASPFIGYFFSSGLIAYGPILTFIGLIVILEIISFSKFNRKEFISIFSFIPFCSLALFYYFLNPLNGEILTTHFLTFILIPFFIFSILYINKNDEKNNLFLLKSILIFLIFQILICLGQIMTLMYGFGLPLSKGHSDGIIITGTFNNSNDLSNIALLSLAILVINKDVLNNKLALLFLVVAFFIIFVTGSRSAIILSILLLLFQLKFKIHNFINICLLIGMVLLFYIFALSVSDSDSINRMISRFDSILNVYNNGIDSDGSMYIRLQSYIHFLDNIPYLGLGSGELKNYYIFSNNALFQTWLIFENPHSLIVEVGYWLGFLGLFFIITPFIWLVYVEKLKFIFVLIIFVSSFIPSSVLGSFIYFLFIFILILGNRYSHRGFK